MEKKKKKKLKTFFCFSFFCFFWISVSKLQNNECKTKKESIKKDFVLGTGKRRASPNATVISSKAKMMWYTHTYWSMYTTSKMRLCSKCTAYKRPFFFWGLKSGVTFRGLTERTITLSIFIIVPIGSLHCYQI